MSHRISIEFGENDYLIDQPDGRVYNSEVGRSFALDHIFIGQQEIVYHRENGFSSNCVRCQDEARKAALAPAAPAADGEPCSMADFPTLGDDVDADERDREAETSYARRGW